MEELLRQIEILVPTMEGWCTPIKARYMAEVICLREPRVIVEVGVLSGRSLLPLGLAARWINTNTLFPAACVYGFDPYSNLEVTLHTPAGEYYDWWRAVDLQKCYREARAHLRACDLLGTVELVREPSLVAVTNFADGEIEFLHIDGNHSEVSSCADVRAWLPKMRHDSVIVMDDTLWESVQPARQMLTAACKLMHTGENWEVYLKE